MKSFYQDRLGTQIRKSTQKGDVFLQAIGAFEAGATAQRSAAQGFA
eukprot:COSAG06_NODE_3362_length_5453_cov_5.741688_2_plen_46_part_00